MDTADFGLGSCSIIELNFIIRLMFCLMIFNFVKRVLDV